MPSPVAAHPETIRVVHTTHDTAYVVVRDTVHDTVTVQHTVAVHDTVHAVAASPPQAPMTLDGLLALLALLLAIFALAGPTQRRSFFILLPVRRMLLWLAAAVVLVLIPDLVRLVGFEPHRIVAIGFPLVAFGLAVWVTINGIATWMRGTIPTRSLGAVQELSLSALNEGQFDEIGRLLRRNTLALRSLPEDALVALFDPALVQAMVARRNYAHLELLGVESAFGGRQAALTGVDIVAHALLHADPSPLTSVIVKALGGDDRHAALQSEEALAAATFGSWRWYTAARVGQIIGVVGYEALMTGRYDDTYNMADPRYDAHEGTSGRIKCPAYRAIALHYLALKDAQRHGELERADPNDMFSVFKAAFARSRYVPERPPWDGIKDAPTPFAYLMHETLSFLEHLARDGYAHAMGDLRFPGGDGRDLPVPTNAEAIFLRTCENWALCTWLMSTESRMGAVDRHSWANGVPNRFIISAIREYMSETLRFGFEYGVTPQRTTYAEIAARALRRHVNDDRMAPLVREAFASLDMGKRYVYEGRDWLRAELGLPLEGG